MLVNWKVYARGEAAMPPIKFGSPQKAFFVESVYDSYSSIIHEASSASRFVYIWDKLLEPRGGYLLLLNMCGCGPSWLSLVTCSIIGRSFYASHVSTKMLCGESLKGCGNTKRCPSDPYVAVQKVSIIIINSHPKAVFFKYGHPKSNKAVQKRWLDSWLAKTLDMTDRVIQYKWSYFI